MKKQFLAWALSIAALIKEHAAEIGCCLIYAVVYIVGFALLRAGVKAVMNANWIIDKVLAFVLCGIGCGLKCFSVAAIVTDIYKVLHKDE